MDDLVITNNVQETRFQAMVGGHLALLDYRIGGGEFRIDYVYVPASHRGQGIAGMLMEAAIAYAEGEGLRVNPICSYARSYLARRG